MDELKIELEEAKEDVNLLKKQIKREERELVRPSLYQTTQCRQYQKDLETQQCEIFRLRMNLERARRNVDYYQRKIRLLERKIRFFERNQGFFLFALIMI